MLAKNSLVRKALLAASCLHLCSWNGKKRPGKEQAAALQLCVHTKHHSAVVEDDKKGFLVVKSSQPAKQNLLTKDTALTGLKYCCGFH